MSTRSVVCDLLENHGRQISRDYVQSLSNELGKEIGNSESRWTYSLPKEVLSKTQVVGIGRDGTTTHIRADGYRETMSGTISFYDKEGIRLHTVYQAQAPEYGKSTFDKRFSKRIEEVKAQFYATKTKDKSIQYVGLADGAKDNWTFLEKHVDTSILDFWHACEYLTLASKNVSKSVYLQKQWLIAAKAKLQNDTEGAQGLLKEMKGFIKKRGFSKSAKEGLNRAITYFKNHHHQMSYDLYKKQNYPIGSGVTEAACKVIVKQRLSCSGMSWKINSAQNVLNIRALRYSNGEWKQFWNNVDTFHFSEN